MYKIGDMVKVVSCEKGIDPMFLNKLGTIDKINEKEYYRYHICFRNKDIDSEAKYYWWHDNNIEIFNGNPDEVDELSDSELYKKVILTTTNNVDGYRVQKYIDVISYEYVIGTGPLSEFTSGFQDLVGARSTAFEEKLTIAKKVALDKMRYTAHSYGGDAVIGLGFEYANFEGNRVAVIITGTVVKLVDNSAGESSLKL